MNNISVIYLILSHCALYPLYCISLVIEKYNSPVTNENFPTIRFEETLFCVCIEVEFATYSLKDFYK